MRTNNYRYENILSNPDLKKYISNDSYFMSGYLDKTKYDWIVNNPEWTTFTITVTFKSLVAIESGLGMKLASEYEYEKHVLNKIKRRLCRVNKYWNEVLPISDVFRYEKNETSIFKGVATKQTPHHIHGIIPVLNDRVDRIWDSEVDSLDQRLLRDLKSLSKVSTFKIEKLINEKSDDWYYYMNKDKLPKNFNS
jgi:hypothetical protein